MITKDELYGLRVLCGALDSLEVGLGYSVGIYDDVDEDSTEEYLEVGKKVQTLLLTAVDLLNDAVDKGYKELYAEE